MTAGRAVVATDAGGLGHTVRESGCGLVVPVGDEPAFADALVRVLGDPELAESLAAGGREAAATTYSWDRCARDTMAVYEEVARA